MPKPRRKEQPLWKSRQQQQDSAGRGSVVVRGRDARLLTEELKKQREAKGKPATAATQPTAPAVISNRAFRFRFQLIPLIWLGAAGLALAAQSYDAWAIALVVYLIAGGAVPLLTRHLSPFTRKALACWSACLAVVGPATAIFGRVAWLDVAALIVWGVISLRWIHHYGWRPAVSKTDPPRPSSAQEIWAQLSAKNKWESWLGPAKPIPNGQQFIIICRGTHTNISQIMARPEAVAAAYDKPITEAYVERERSGIQSRGLFTRLTTGTLDAVREWDGMSIDRRTGLAVVGRFPDGRDVHERVFSLPRDGVKHTIISGTPGSGKSGKLDLGLSISAVSGIVVPVVLDPQMGQALPAWRDHVAYACGNDQCLKLLYGLYMAMMDRSDLLSQMEWTDDKGRTRRGMGFFNPFLCGLPIIEITIDEAPILIAYKQAIGMEKWTAVRLILDIAKLGRKTGFRLRLAAQVPSISELGKGELRSQLVGGNAFCLRAGDNVTRGMMGIKANPAELPEAFSDGSETYGLGYADTMDGRPDSPMRLDFVPDPYEVAEQAKIATMDDRCASAMAKALSEQDEIASQLAQATTQAQAEGRVAELAVLRALGDGSPRSMGELILACQPVPMSQVTDAVSNLLARGEVTRDGSAYRLAGPPSRVAA